MYLLIAIWLVSSFDRAVQQSSEYYPYLEHHCYGLVPGYVKQSQFKKCYD